MLSGRECQPLKLLHRNLFAREDPTSACGKMRVPGSRRTPAAAELRLLHTLGAASRERGVVRFSAPLAVVSERLDAEAGYLEAVDDATCRYVTAPDSWEWLAVTLAAVGVPYTIEGPPELADLSRSLAERIAAAADG
ncbi:WYL domain-containing protein [Saccharomonospora xinjiangensis]|nr:hypothetical protein EYD13_12620 [Saccharomonospora xinjiangensis]